MKKKTYTSGYTLIEILVSVGIIAIVMSVLAQGFFSTFRTNVKTELIKDVKQNGDYALDVITRMVRNSTSIATTCATNGTTTPTLSVVSPDGLTTTFQCTLDGTVPRIASVSGSNTDYLTSKNVSLGAGGCPNALIFICTSLVSGGTSVQINFTLGQVGTPPDQFEQASSPFQTTVVTRQ